MGKSPTRAACATSIVPRALRGSPASCPRYPWNVEGDEGYFGPTSVSWQVHREVTVLFGGARAMLMHAAHPLVIAGANQTGMYERNPWKRLQRTLVLQYALTFGTKAEAHAAADRINEVHERINGVDPVTGRRYDALDPELLLWVHACLVESALLFERLTVGRLDDRGRQRFHEEQMLAAELVRLPRERIPPTVPELEAYVRGHRPLGRADRDGRCAERGGPVPRPATGCAVAARVAVGGQARLRDASRRDARGVRPPSEGGGASDEAGDVRGAARGSAPAAGEVPFHRAVRSVAPATARSGGSGRGRPRSSFARDPPVMTHSRT